MLCCCALGDGRKSQALEVPGSRRVQMAGTTAVSAGWLFEMHFPHGNKVKEALGFLD